MFLYFSFSRSVMSTSLQYHGLQHTMLLCPSPSSESCSNSCPLNQRCYPTILSFVIPISSCLLSFLASGHFPMSYLFASGGQRIGASASASVSPMNIQDWLHLWLTGLTSLQSKRLSGVFSSTTVQNHQFFSAQPSLWSNAHPYMTTGKTIYLTMWTFVSRVIFLLFNMLSRFVTAFLMMSNHLKISWLQSPCTVILEPRKIVFHWFHCFPHICAMNSRGFFFFPVFLKVLISWTSSTVRMNSL